MSAETTAAPETFLLVEEVADRLRMSQWTVRSLIRSGDLPAIRLGRGKRSPYRVAESDLTSFVADHRYSAG